jgi:hypothetical protein
MVTIMKIFGAPRREPFWVVTFIAFVNVVLVIVSAVHNRDFWVRLPLFTILVAVVAIWVGSDRLQKILCKVCPLVDEKTGMRLTNLAYLIAFMANLAILTALPLLR